MTDREWDILAAVAYNDGVWRGGYSIFFNGMKITRLEFIDVKEKFYD